MELTKPASQFHCPLIRLSTAIAEENLVKAAILHQQFCQAYLRNSVELVRRLNQRSGLLSQRLNQHRMAMAQAIHGPAANKVKVFPVIVIPDSCPLPADYGQRQTLDSLHEISSLQL